MKNIQIETKTEIKKDFDWYLKAAKEGDAEAQNYIGYCYDVGNVVKKDNKTALEWYLKAAKQNNALAQYNVALFYYLGDGIEEDKNIAFSWFLKAAEQGDAEAQCYVGYYYDEGICVEEDKKTALEWYLKAAEQDNALAQSIVAGLYALGEGVEQNKSEAFKWGLKAAEHGDAEMQCIIAYSYALGEGVKQNKKEAFKWFLKAAEQGNIDAQIEVKKYYYETRNAIKTLLRWIKAIKTEQEYKEHSSIEEVLTTRNEQLLSERKRDFDRKVKTTIYLRRITIASLFIIVYFVLLCLTWHFGWNTMEPYTYFFGLTCLYFTSFYVIFRGEKWDLAKYFREEDIRKSLKTKMSKSQNEFRKKIKA